MTYVVTINPGGVTKTVTGATTATLYGLQNGVAYSFTVVASNSIGQSPASVASGAVVPLAPKLEGQKPNIVGKLAVGNTLTVATPGWAPGTTFDYQWRVDGVAVVGATKPSLAADPSMAGKRLSVSVTGSNHAYVKGDTETSAATPRLATAATPTIVGKSTVGSTLHVHVGKWTAGTKFTYAWYVSGKRVPRDPGPALLLTANHLGKVVTVRVTGSKSGYATITVTSSPTAAVRH